MHSIFVSFQYVFQIIRTMTPAVYDGREFSDTLSNDL